MQLAWPCSTDLQLAWLGSCAGQSRAQNGKHAAAGLQTEQPGEGAKGEGNTAFSAGNFDEAVRCYSRAIQADSSNPVYYSNRAMAHLKVSRVFLFVKTLCVVG